jgi:hypothetical protein
LAWHAAQIVSLPGSTSNGAPQRMQIGLSMNEMAFQQAEQSECGSLTRTRQRAHSGGKSKSRPAWKPRRAISPADAVICLSIFML